MEPQLPRESVLHLEDGPVGFEAKSLDDLAAQLRQRYPDAEYERRLHGKRDYEAEARWKNAMKGLIEILAEAAVDQALREGKPERG